MDARPRPRTPQAHARPPGRSSFRTQRAGTLLRDPRPALRRIPRLDHRPARVGHADRPRRHRPPRSRFSNVRSRAQRPAQRPHPRPQPGRLRAARRAPRAQEVRLMPFPLQGLRIATTLPPHTWFGGVDYNFAIEMSAELRELGAEVFDLDVAAFTCRNQAYIRHAIDALKSFRPDVAFALPNALYSLLCATPKPQQNVFTDILQIPTILLWDHGLLQLPYQILQPMPSTPAEGRAGSIRRLRQVLNHPLYRHYSPDRGHIAALDKLGVISASKVRFFLQ